MRTGALVPTKKSPRVKLRVMAAASSSVRLRGRLVGRKLLLFADADVLAVAGLAAKAL